MLPLYLHVNKKSDNGGGDDVCNNGHVRTQRWKSLFQKVRGERTAEFGLKF